MSLLPSTEPVKQSASGRGRAMTLLIGAVLAFAIGGLVSWQRLQPAASDDAALQALRTMTLPDSNGQPLDLSQYRGRILIVNFWASWCAPCVEEMPELSELARELAPDRAQIIGIGVDSATNIAAFARRRQFSYPLLVAGASGLEMLRSLGNSSGSLPFTLLINANGQIAYQYVGRLNIAKLRAQLARLPK